MITLRDDCKQRLKIAFDSIRAISGSLTFILVVDECALKVISSTIKMMELVNYGINSVERLHLQRKKFKNIEAVYLIHPESYGLLLEDYQDDPQYGSFHILTLTKIPIHIMDELSKNIPFVKRVKSLKELNFNFIFHSHNEFLIEKGGENYSKNSISGSETDFQGVINVTVDELSTVVTSMSQFYIVEIYYSAAASVGGMAEKIAYELKDKLDKMFDLYGKLNVQNYTNGAPQTTFLILDRCYDAVSPLMRDFHYMPLLYELKDAQKHRVEGQSKQKKTYIMDENQPIFEKYKYEHISKAMDGIVTDFEIFSKSHVGAKMEKTEDGKIGLDKMNQVMKKIPQYTELKDKYSFHLNATKKIMNNYESNKYRMLGELEQNLVCQVGENGKMLKTLDLFNDVVKTIGSITDQRQKVRILAIALMTLDLKPKEKTSLLQQLQSCKQYREFYKNMQKISGSLLYRMGPKKNNKQELILDRHQPKIEQSVRKIIEGGQADLKYFRVGTEGRGKVPLKSAVTSTLGRKKLGATMEKVTKPRLIVFFCTGISYSEIRALSQYEKDYHIIYGSHSFFTPKQYMSFLNSLGQDEL